MVTGYNPDDVRAYQLSGSTDDIDEWLERRREAQASTGDAAPGHGGPSRRPSIPSKRCEHDGFKFDSITEGNRYLWLKAQSDVAWIDVHPVVSLPGGIRYKADFMVWLRDCQWCGKVKIHAHVEDVKGDWILKRRRLASQLAFEIKRKLFDHLHPLAPLQVVTFDSKAGAWIEC